MRGSVREFDHGEWCWASVVVRVPLPDRQGARETPEAPSSCAKPANTLAPQAMAQSNLSICPPDGQSGQVDRSVSAFENRTGITHNGIEGLKIIENDADIPRQWAKAYARLDPACPPADVPLRRWAQLIDDIGRFLNGRFAEKAAVLGWTELDLFGYDRHKPFARVDRQGLCWLIAGSRLVDLSEKKAVIERWTGARQTWRRKPSDPGRALAWDLVP
jgi:hypothetical protein